MLHGNFSAFQVTMVHRAVPARPYTLQSIWITHFTRFDVRYIRQREHNENFLWGVKLDSTM